MGDLGGLACTATALLGILLSWAGPLAQLPSAAYWSLCLLVAAFPITVTYAVLRYRVIDIRFVVSRSLTLGTLAGLVGLVVIGSDWVVSSKIPTSRFQTAAYLAIAFLMGLILSAVRRRTARMIALLFFRQRLTLQEKADIIASRIRRASFKEELYEPLTMGIADAFALASAALFERESDGGFGRIAAYGWPAGSLWNILLDDPLVARTQARPRSVELGASEWRERRLPLGVARPATMVPIIVGKRVPAILLCGLHTNGSSMDPDDLRSLRRLAVEAAVVYGASENYIPYGQPRLAIT